MHRITGDQRIFFLLSGILIFPAIVNLVGLMWDTLPHNFYVQILSKAPGSRSGGEHPVLRRNSPRENLGIVGREGKQKHSGGQ
jgi:hypothetical protein